MTNEQYEKLVKLVDSIEFIDKELIDTNKFIMKFHNIFSKDYEIPTIYPWNNKPGVRDIGASSAPAYPFHDSIQIMYDGPAKDDNKIMYDGPPEQAPFCGINYLYKSDKTNGVDEMKFTISDDSSDATKIGYHGITTSNNV